MATNTVGNTSTFFTELPIVLAHLATITSPSLSSASPATVTAAVAATCDILDRYLESPTLLDPHLEDLMTVLVSKASTIIHTLYGDTPPTEPDTTMPTLHNILTCIHSLCKVRGYKTVVKLFTHEAADLEPTLAALRDLDPKAKEWESRYSLLLWLSMLALVPFDIVTIDSTTEGTSGVTSTGSIVTQIITLSISYLGDAGPCRSAAAVCLASILTRPDMELTYLSEFMNTAAKVLEERVEKKCNAVVKSEANDEAGGFESHLEDNTFQTMGVIHTLALLFKTGHREKFLPYVNTFMSSIIQIAEHETSQTLLRKLLVKVFQRIGCTFMPVRVVKWRYQRGRRSLVKNMTNNASKATSDATDATNATSADSAEDTSTCLTEPDIHVPPELEDVVDQLLVGLRDRDTVVRWSAAKGLGRITERLPRECADDVVASILAVFSDAETDSAWHGGCLALAELARRGLLLPSRLPVTVPIITRAIHYDVRRGQNSVGAHVRDAACYVCWAFARAYAPDVMKPFVHDLSVAMLLAALFDREINCRRAASAAFQENVGRQGNENFQHGIDILTAADYFTLGNRHNAYTSIADFVAQFETYRHPIIDHLRKTKLAHWDVEIRELASRGLATLTHLDEEYMTQTVITDLLSRVTHVDLLTRHGAVLGIAEVVRELGVLGSKNVNARTDELVDVIVRIEKARLYRGKGGEIMRSAVCRLIECVSLANLPLSVKQSVTLLDTLDDCIKHPLEGISIAAVSGLRALTRSYFPVTKTGPSDRLYGRVVDKYLKVVSTEDNAAATRGFSLAIGALPAKFIAFNGDVLRTVVKQLCECAQIDATVGEEPDAETRRNCVKALEEIVQTVGVGEVERAEVVTTDGGTLTPFGLGKGDVELVFETLHGSLEDYSMDKRGDVGSWVRCAALTAIKSLTVMSVKASVGVAWDTKEGNEEDMAVPNMAERMKFLEPSIGTTVPTCLKEGKPLRETFVATAANERYFDVDTCQRVLGSILKQLSEKLDNVRDLAGGILCDLLTNEEVRLPFVQDRGFLVAALSSKDDTVNWASPTTTFAMMVKAMNIDAYHGPIVEGLCVSVGGLTESVVKSSSGALLDWVRTMKKLKGSKHMMRLGRTLLGLLEREKKNERIVVPVLRTIHLLYRNDAVGGGEENAGEWKEGEEKSDQMINDFDSRLLKLVLAESHGSKSFKKLTAIVDVLIDFLGHGMRVEGREMAGTPGMSLKFLMILLAHPFPKIRKFVAEQLYVVVLENEEVVAEDGRVDEVGELLLETAWDGELEEDVGKGVREVRNDLCALLGVQLSDKARSAKVKKGGVKGGKEVDEHESYQSLVSTAGR